MSLATSVILVCLPAWSQVPAASEDPVVELLLLLAREPTLCEPRSVLRVLAIPVNGLKPTDRCEYHSYQGLQIDSSGSNYEIGEYVIGGINSVFVKVGGPCVSVTTVTHALQKHHVMSAVPLRNTTKYEMRPPIRRWDVLRTDAHQTWWQTRLTKKLHIALVAREEDGCVSSVQGFEQFREGTPNALLYPDIYPP
jgi:hypothetical protein